MRSARAVPFLIACALFHVRPMGIAAQVEISARAARITIGGRLHTQFITSSPDTSVSQFFFRRARIQADIRVGDYFDGRIEPEFAGGRIGLQDAYARLTIDPAFAISAGQYKRAFSYIDLASANDLPVIEREGNVPGERCRGVGGVCSYSRLTQQLQFDGRDIGVRVEGEIDRFSYNAMVTNGQGVNASDVNNTKSTSARIELRPVEDVRLGVFGALHDYPDPIPVVDDDDFAEAFGADVELGTFRSGFHLIAGAVMGNNWRLGPEVDFAAAQALASYYVELGEAMAAGIEPMFRVSWADPDRDQEDDGGLLLTPGLMLYFQGRNGIAVNLDSYSPDGDRGSEWSFKAQVFMYF